MTVISACQWSGVGDRHRVDRLVVEQAAEVLLGPRRVFPVADPRPSPSPWRTSRRRRRRSRPPRRPASAGRPETARAPARARRSPPPAPVRWPRPGRRRESRQTRRRAEECPSSQPDRCPPPRGRAVIPRHAEVSGAHAWDRSRDERDQSGRSAPCKRRSVLDNLTRTVAARSGRPKRRSRSGRTAWLRTAWPPRRVVVIGTVARHPAGPGHAARGQGPVGGPASAEFEVVVEKNVTIPMRDGVPLAADIYRPGAGRQAGRGAVPGAPDPHALRQERGEGGGPVLRRAGLRRRRQRRPRPLRQRGDLAADRRRSRRTATTSSSGSPGRTGPTARSARSAPAIPAAPSTPWPR